MIKYWRDALRQCPVCNQRHHFLYVIEPGPSVVYCFECPVTKQMSDIRASETVELCTGPVDDKDAIAVPAVAKLSRKEHDRLPLRLEFADS